MKKENQTAQSSPVEKTIFEKIIVGEIPSYKIYEDNHTFAFLDINPNTPGHTLIVPKKVFDHVLNVEEPYYSSVFENAKKIGRAIQKATGSKRIGYVVAGFDVPHFHLHLVPLNETEDIAPGKARPADLKDLEDMEKKIKSFL